VLLPKSNFHCSTISKAPLSLLSLAFGWTTLRKLPIAIGYEKKKKWFAHFYSSLPHSPDASMTASPRVWPRPPARVPPPPPRLPTSSDRPPPHWTCLTPVGRIPARRRRLPCLVACSARRPDVRPSELQHRPTAAASTDPQHGCQPQPRVP
jgi:hypothetical protein